MKFLCTLCDCCLYDINSINITQTKDLLYPGLIIIIRRVYLTSFRFMPRSHCSVFVQKRRYKYPFLWNPSHFSALKCTKTEVRERAIDQCERTEIDIFFDHSIVKGLKERSGYFSSVAVSNLNAQTLTFLSLLFYKIGALWTVERYLQKRINSWAKQCERSISVNYH